MQAGNGFYESATESCLVSVGAFKIRSSIMNQKPDTAISGFTPQKLSNVDGKNDNINLISLPHSRIKCLLRSSERRFV